MLFVLIALLLTTNIAQTDEVQCITNCTVGGFKFGDSFSFPGAQCQQRTQGSDCTMRVNFNYHDRTYNVEFGKNRSSADFIYINSLPYLSYTINHYCSDQTDCVLSNIQKKIDTMVGRTYDAAVVYDQLAPLIDDPSRSSAIECYNMKNEIVQCGPDQICGLSYNQKEQEMRARGCYSSDAVRIFVYDSDFYSALHVDCTRNLCNDDTTLTSIKNILVQNGLTDANGRRVISDGTRDRIYFPLMIFPLISIILSYF